MEECQRKYKRRNRLCKAKREMNMVYLKYLWFIQ